MNPNRQLSVLLVSAALWLPVSAAAQGHDADCLDLAARLCGETPVGQCFAADEALWQRVPDRCSGDLQTMIEMEREAGEQNAEDAALLAADVRDFQGGRLGNTYGGQLRSGPGTSHTRVAGLAEGERIRILENTGQWFDDYLWYRVQTRHGEGYLWGGLFCADGGGEQPEGVLTTCGSTHEAQLFGGVDDPDASPVVLRGDGVAVGDGQALAFGGAQDATIDALTGAFGQAPSSLDTITECTGGAQVLASWDNGFAAFFKRGKFIGWTAVDQRTAAGIGFGSSRADLEAAHDVRVKAEEEGATFAGEGFSGWLETAAPDARITDFRAGTSCSAG